MITSWTRAIDSRVTHLSILTIFQDFPFVQRYKPFPPRRFARREQTFFRFFDCF